jgi:hypothetical protein
MIAAVFSFDAFEFEAVFVDSPGSEGFVELKVRCGRVMASSSCVELDDVLGRSETPTVPPVCSKPLLSLSLLSSYSQRVHDLGPSCK